MRRQTRTVAAMLGAALGFFARPGYPSALDTQGFWQHVFDVLEAFPPNYVASADSGTVWQSGYCGNVTVVRCWPAASLPFIVIAAGFPADQPPPEDGLAWAVLGPWTWRPPSLPDAASYCLRWRALWMAQVLRAAESTVGQPVKAVILAEGLDAPPALAVAAFHPDRVEGVVLVNPRPWQHLNRGKVALEGAEGRALAAVLARHPDWAAALGEALRPYDIAELAPLVGCPVVVVASLWRPEPWLLSAAEEFGWALVDSGRRNPPLAELVRSKVFDVLWPEALGFIRGGL
ncbi:MAG: hypothetical protein H5T86_03485 [Armatimonadetes bacterium]|nr:hypothetical protein [Armatimonadota bacterium]